MDYFLTIDLCLVPFQKLTELGWSFMQFCEKTQRYLEGMETSRGRAPWSLERANVSSVGG